MSADERRFQTGFQQEDVGQPGLILKDDETVWLILPDLSEVELPSNGSISGTITDSIAGQIAMPV